MKPEASYSEWLQLDREQRERHKARFTGREAALWAYDAEGKLRWVGGPVDTDAVYQWLTEGHA